MGAIRPPDPSATLRVLGIDLAAELSAVETLTDDEAKALTADILARAKAHYRELAIEHHPDKCGDDARMKEINAAWDWVRRLRLRPRRRSPAYMTGSATAGVYVTKSYYRDSLWRDMKRWPK